MSKAQSKIIALLTDFGLKDIYVGVMKGVIATICPEAQCIDITHAIKAQDVRAGALALLNAYGYFPAGTVFLVVVDPGVGSTRRPIAAQVGDYFFVAPDNGVLSYVLAQSNAINVVEAAHRDLQLPDVSYTFHGRDIFAPVAAHLATGLPLHELGPTVDEWMILPPAMLQIAERQITGEVVQVDNFGNLITSIGRLNWVGANILMLVTAVGNRQRLVADQSVVHLGGQTIEAVKHSYSEVLPGELLLLIGSNGYLEIAVNQGDAATRLGINVGDIVEVEIGRD